MTTVDNLRNNIIDKLLTITNEDHLAEIYKLLKDNQSEVDLIKLTEEQRLMLQLSDNDIEHEKLIPQRQLDKKDLEWLKEL